MTRRRRLLLLLVWTLPSLAFLVATAIVYGAFRIPRPARLDAAGRAAAVAPLRAAVDGRSLASCALRPGGPGTVGITVWSHGRARLRIDAVAADLPRAIDEAAAQLRVAPGVAAMSVEDRSTARIQVDVITGTAPLGGGARLFDALALPGLPDLLAVNPGIEGIGLRGGGPGGKPAWLLPHELVSARVLAARRPSATVQDLAVGLDLERITRLLATRANLVGAVDRARLYRFRTDTFVEAPRPVAPDPAAAPIALERGIPAAPPLTAAALREAALAGGHFLVAHMAPNGRYIYEHDLSSGGQTDPASASYSMPRHAGTTYFLAELYRITGEPWLREPIERAFAHLAELMANGGCATTLADGTQIDCVMDRQETKAQLGATALAVVALAEYQRATADTRYLPVATRLATFLLWMQRPDGSFRHTYVPATKLASESEMQLYYSGEAALALARMYLVTHDPRYARAAERGLDWVVAQYDFFMGGFFFGEEHWTCIAAEALWPAVKTQKYVDFCADYATFLRGQQAPAADGISDQADQADFAGAYVFTPFIAPSNTPAGSRTEAMISTYLLTRDHGTPDLAIRAQIRAALQYALGQQVRPESDFAVVGPGLGGMPGTPIDRSVRIDYVQHVCSAMIRASEWIDAL